MRTCACRCTCQVVPQLSSKYLAPAQTIVNNYKHNNKLYFIQPPPGAASSAMVGKLAHGTMIFVNRAGSELIPVTQRRVEKYLKFVAGGVPKRSRKGKFTLFVENHHNLVCASKASVYVDGKGLLWSFLLHTAPLSL
jgi:hypothetical protein